MNSIKVLDLPGNGRTILMLNVTVVDRLDISVNSATPIQRNKRQ